jgi:tetratricopeptide (TPR) repeat protein
MPTPTQPRQPDFGQQQQQQFPMTRQPVFLSGKVVLDDGTAPPETVVVETVCGGIVRPQAYTDSKGRFSFQVGQNTNMMMDASVSSVDTPFPRGGTQGGSSGFGRGPGGGDMMGCELRASLAGFRSDLLNLAGRRALDNPEVGVIVLHRLGNVEGTTISYTSLQAPKDAKKSFDKGVDALKKKKWADAQNNLEKAVAIYPKYAAAWYELGRAFHGANNIEKARDAYAKSLEADSKFLKPYMQMAQIAAGERKWDDVERYTSELLRLDPVDYAPAYFLNSVANFNLQKLDAAEKSAREGVKLDSQHQLPKMEHVLGVILANKRDYVGAAQYLRGYLDHAPNAPDADTVRKQLAEVEKFSGPPAAQAQPAKPPQP